VVCSACGRKVRIDLECEIKETNKKLEETENKLKEAFLQIKVLENKFEQKEHA
jgi:hypothetical protein